MKIIRVFPRRTSATPDDEGVRIGPPGLFDEADEVHISASFSWDLPVVERLKYQWEMIAPVKVGGPAVGSPGDEFTPGQYLKKGYVITSRGCPNKCWFCDVWRREGTTRELTIQDGWNVLDSNLLACSPPHIESVFKMLKKQHHPVEFSGGLEASRIQKWHIDSILDLKPKQVFFAYDEPSDLEPLQDAGAMFRAVGWEPYDNGRPNTHLRAYVLCGYPRDTVEAAEKRVREAWAAGFAPMAMLYRNKVGEIPRDREWKKFQKLWSRPAFIAAIMRKQS